MEFYVYLQNNSGGYFVVDDNVSDVVIIEAESERQAKAKLNLILSQDLSYTTYCSCCGKRWGSVDDVYESLEYDTVIFDELKESYSGSSEAILYLNNGTKKNIPWLRYGMYKCLK